MIFCVAPSSSVPTAANCAVVPAAIVRSAGVSAMDTRGEAVKTVVPGIPSRVAVIVVEPALPVEDASPVLFTVAIFGSAESQTTRSDRSSWALFEYFPTAVSCSAVPGAMLGAEGCIVIETSRAGLPVCKLFTLQPGRNAADNMATLMIKATRGPVFMMTSPMKNVTRMVPVVF